MNRILCLICVLLAAWLGTVWAASFPVVYTTAQDTTIQTRVIPFVNAENCAKRSLGPNCNAAQLVQRGCVAVPFPQRNHNVCTIYTPDAAGEALFLKDQLDAKLVTYIVRLNVGDENVFKGACRAGTPAQRTATCATYGIPAAQCNPCP
jgi:hypothetical protein